MYNDRDLCVLEGITTLLSRSADVRKKKGESLNTNADQRKAEGLYVFMKGEYNMRINFKIEPVVYRVRCSYRVCETVNRIQIAGVPLCNTTICYLSIPQTWEEFSWKCPPALPYPPAPQVCLPIASLLVDGISSNLAHMFSSPGKIF